MTKAIKRPKLTEKHQKDRRTLSTKHLNQKSKPANIIFSDEKKFILDNNDKDQYVTRPIDSNPFDDKYMDYDKQLSSNFWLL